MKNARLLSTVTATFLLTMGAASAQDMKKETAPAPAPAAQQNAPAEKMAPNMKAGDKNAETHKAPETTGQTPKPSDANSSANVKSETKTSETPAKDAGKDAAGAKVLSTTTGQGAAAGSVKLSSEQRTKITSIIKQKKVEPAHLNVSVSVGTRIPGNVHYYPLPQEVIVVYPEWRGYDYILVGDQIVIVDPRSHEIVAILEA